MRWAILGKKGATTPVLPSSGCTYSIVSIDYPLPADWTSGDPFLFDEDVTIGYTCTFQPVLLPDADSGPGKFNVLQTDGVCGTMNTGSITFAIGLTRLPAELASLHLAGDRQANARAARVATPVKRFCSTTFSAAQAWELEPNTREWLQTDERKNPA